MQSEQLIQNLLEQTQQSIHQAKGFKNMDKLKLIWRKDATSWNVLECLEHLNLYAEFYLPEIERQIKQSTTQPDTYFKSGILGNYFVKSIFPKERLNRMKTFKDKNPLNKNLDHSVIDSFITNQTRLLDLLHQAQKVSLNRVKIRTSIHRFIRLKLGDAFQFYVYHIFRHFQQIERILKRI